jgi:hypothetical protein
VLQFFKKFNPQGKEFHLPLADKKNKSLASDFTKDQNKKGSSLRRTLSESFFQLD